jgi:hypothetical protein
MRYFSDFFKLSVGQERILVLTLTFLFLIHIATCLWIFTASLDELGKDNWVYAKGYQDF